VSDVAVAGKKGCFFSASRDRRVTRHGFESHRNHPLLVGEQTGRNCSLQVSKKLFVLPGDVPNGLSWAIRFTPLGRSIRRWDCKTLESDLQLAHAQGALNEGEERANLLHQYGSNVAGVAQQNPSKWMFFFF